MLVSNYFHITFITNNRNAIERGTPPILCDFARIKTNTSDIYTVQPDITVQFDSTVSIQSPQGALYKADPTIINTEENPTII